LKLLAPLAPFVTEHLYQASYGKQIIVQPQESIHHQTWPSFDPELLVESTVTLVVQVNGKLRGSVTVSQAIASDQVQAIEAIKELPLVSQYLANGYRKVIFVTGKLLNFVV
jgi:leucyl-tRNA synthetase